MIRLQPISSVGVTLRAQHRVLDRLVDLAARRARGTAAAASGGASCPAAASSWNQKITCAVEPLEHREALEQPLACAPRTRSPSSGASSPASAGRRRPARPTGWIAGTTWIALHPVPTTATRLPASVDVVPPLGGVERRAREAVEARDRRNGRDRELAAGGQQHVRLVRARARLAAPTCRARRPSAPLHLDARPDPVDHAVAPRDVLEVGLDLGLRRVAARPASGSGRTRTRRGGTGRRTPRRDRCCGARRRRRARRARTRSRRWYPARRSITAAPTPPKPPPTTATEATIDGRWCSLVNPSRSDYPACRFFGIIDRPDPGGHR